MSETTRPTEPGQPRKVGIKARTLLERLLVDPLALPGSQHRRRRDLARHLFPDRQQRRLPDLAVMSVVLRDTGRIGMIAVREVMLMITGEIDLSVGSTFSLAPYLMVLMRSRWGLPLWLGAR